MSFQNKYLKYKNKYINLKGGSSGGAEHFAPIGGRRRGGSHSDDELFIFPKKKYIIGIAGASGCGKSYLAKDNLKNLFERYGISTTIISCDNYYKPYLVGGNPSKAPLDFNWDTPDVIDLDLFSSDLDKFKRNISINVPNYNFKTSQREGILETIKSSDFQVLIVEGLYVLYRDDIRSKLDLKIFAESDLEICLARRISRDIAERGKTPADTPASLQNYELYVRPSYQKYIEPKKKNADIIVNTDIDYRTTKTLDIIIQYVLLALK
jgi:uridine kinase